jgi:hypothetical protein
MKGKEADIQKRTNKRDWMAALKNINGVYLIVDKNNGMMNLQN